MESDQRTRKSSDSGAPPPVRLQGSHESLNLPALTDELARAIEEVVDFETLFALRNRAELIRHAEKLSEPVSWCKSNFISVNRYLLLRYG